MRIVIFILFVVCVMFTDLFAQNTSKQNSKLNVRVNDKKPTVFITFEGVDKSGSKENTEGTEMILLRLHNNTRWAIWVDASDRDEKLEKAELYFDILKNEERQDESRSCHVCSAYEIKPGKSLLFSAPSVFTSNEVNLRLRFYFDWEDSGDSFVRREPNHYVYFYTRNLKNYGSQKP